MPLNLEYIFIINIFMAILVTMLCERAGDHGGRRRPSTSTAALLRAQRVMPDISLSGQRCQDWAPQ